MISATWEMVEKIRDRRDEVLAKLDAIEEQMKIAERSLVEAGERIEALEKAARRLLAAYDDAMDSEDWSVTHAAFRELRGMLEPVVQTPDVVDSLAHQPERCDCPKENCTCPCNRCAFGPY